MPKAQRSSFLLRMPPEVDSFIEEEARRNMRSKNGEIVFRLMRSREKENALTAGAGGEKGDGTTLEG